MSIALGLQKGLDETGKMDRMMKLTHLALTLCIAAASLNLMTSSVSAQPKPDHDPWEPLNRKIFWFNDKLDVYVLEPVAKGWAFLLPHVVQRSVDNFLNNLTFPVVFVNDILQGKLRGGASAAGRFALNTTVGVGGLLDPASSWGLEAQEEDTGQTLGKWGISPGPYLVLPLLGPSNPRDAIGLVADGSLLVFPWFVGRSITLGVGAIDAINLRSLALDDVDNAKAAALDYYTFVRNAYVQRRYALVHDTTVMSDHQQDDLYDIELTDEE